MTVRWWRVLAVWPVAFALSVAGTVLALLVTPLVQGGDVGTLRETGYFVLWILVLAAVPAVIIGVPVLAVVAVGLRAAHLAWQVLAVGGAAAWVAAGCTTLLWSPWGPFRWMSVDPAASYPWGPVAVVAGISAVAWGWGTSAAWAVVRPVRTAEVAWTTAGRG